jgi:F420H(2)-dependent quinone reductase
VQVEAKRRPRLPPRWFMRAFWYGHRALLRVTGGRVGLWRPKRDTWGALRLTTVGRRSGGERSVVVGYFEDGPNLVTMAMNGWGEGEPAWWLNLQAHPDAEVQLVDGRRLVTGRAAEGEERERLWARWRQIDKDLDAFAARRSTQTAVVVFEPRPDADGRRVDREEPVAVPASRRGNGRRRRRGLVGGVRGRRRS